MKSKIKVVIDTQIFLRSWFYTKYFYCDAIMDLIDKDELFLLFSQETIGELFYMTKLMATHIFDEKNIQLDYLHILSAIFLDARSINTFEVECPELKDKTDEMLLKTAIKGEADFIISDDFRSGIHNIEIEGIKILSSEQFVSIYEGLVKR